MKHNKVFRILALAVILSLLMFAIPATPVLAVTFQLSSYSGPVGTVITVAGSGFTAGASGYVWFDSDKGGDLDAGEPQVSVTTTTDALPAGVTLTVPTVPRATYTVYADIPSGSTIEANSSFTVTPKITLSASTGNVGDTVTVNGNGFAASAGITILFDDVSKGTTTATATGTFTSFSLTVPESIKSSSHIVKAQETSSTTNYATSTFTVSPEIALDIASGAVGDEVTVTGTGFAASSDIIISFDGDEVAIGGDDSTSSKGSFESTFDVPTASRGSHTVEAVDEDDNSDTATFTVGQKITINPDSGSSGITVTVTGTGFRASKDITVTYNDVDITDDITGDSETDSAGSFEFTFAVPAGNAGTYEVEVSDGSYSATADFESTTSATISQTTTSADPGYVGMELTITGTGFTPSSFAVITYETTSVTLARPATDDNGNFTVTVTIPASASGAHTITVKDETTNLIIKTFTFYMESEAPPVPSLALPAVDTKLEDGQFTWGTVTDDSLPVTYDFQVAADSSFATPLLNKTGLETSAYTLLETEKLESTGKDEPYYWHVRAVDAASNASAWSSPGTFYVGIGIMAWLPYILMVVIAIVFFVFGVWVGKRSGGY